MADQKSSEEPPDSFTMENGFFNHLGFRLVTWEEDLAVLEFEIEPYHLNRALVLHGGVLTSIIDIACGFAGCFSLDPNRVRKTVTLSLTTSFTGQASFGIVRPWVASGSVGAKFSSPPRKSPPAAVSCSPLVKEPTVTAAAVNPSTKSRPVSAPSG